MGVAIARMMISPMSSMTRIPLKALDRLPRMCALSFMTPRTTAVLAHEMVTPRNMA